MSSVTVRVPATTGNMGSGFDCVGMALGLYNTVEIIEETSGISVEVSGEGTDLVPLDASNACVVAANRVLDEIGYDIRGLRFRLNHEIPVSRGLGSSGVAIVAGAFGANELTGRTLDVNTLIRICSELEGHPDNVVPSLLGGLSISGPRYGTIVYQTYDMPSDLSAVVAVPDFALETRLAREALPESVPLDDAVYNVCSVGLLVGGLLSGDYSLLRAGTDDRLHQPYRASLVPGLVQVMDAALNAGSHSAALSGAGPTVIALASESHEQVAEAMAAAFLAHDITSRTMVLSIDNAGAQILT
ncbi:MAG: homoserine kinase [Candidatus Latescibacteria bacterium]|nr:homoserine kinase [Candidatus Latescibacterota bacterium]